MGRQQQTENASCRIGGGRIAADQRRNDGAIDQDGQFSHQFIDAKAAGLFGQLAQDGSHCRFMFQGDGADMWLAFGIFGDGIHQSAAEIILTLEPLAQHLEQSRQPLAGRGSGVKQCSLQPVPPSLAFPPQDGFDQSFLGAELVVERHFSDASLGHDAVDTGGMNAFAAEQAAGRSDDALRRLRPVAVFKNRHVNAPLSGQPSTGRY